MNEPRILHDEILRYVRIAKDRGMRRADAIRAASEYLEREGDLKDWKYLYVNTRKRDWVVIYTKRGQL
jgi:hypothetical protein